jgi:hypothetical protein
MPRRKSQKKRHSGGGGNEEIYLKVIIHNLKIIQELLKIYDDHDLGSIKELLNDVETNLKDVVRDPKGVKDRMNEALKSGEQEMLDLRRFPLITKR